MAGRRYIELKDNSGTTALHWAVIKNRQAIVSLLLKYNANSNTSDVLDETPIQTAKHLGHKAIVDLLRQHGAKE